MTGQTSNMALASEQGHWYDRAGRPVYEVPRADGKGVRPATLADARKLNLFPGVTGVIACASKPGLERWKREQVLLSALTLPRQDNEPEAEWIKRVFTDSEEQARKAAKKGTEIHAQIEHYFQTTYFPDPRTDKDGYAIIAAVDAHLCRKYEERKWVPEKSFVSPLGFGCKVDLVSSEVIIDFKTKEFLDVSKKLAWDEHAMQLAANRKASGYETAKCANVFISTSVPGLVHIHEWAEEELDRAWEKFKALLAYWKADRNYYPL